MQRILVDYAFFCTTLFAFFVPSIPASELTFFVTSPYEEGVGRFGYSVSDAGDVNGDGSPDLIVGAPWEDPATAPVDAGRAYVFSGETGMMLLELESPNQEIYGFFGTSVSGAGDVNADGYADLLVGSYEDPGSSPEQAGRVAVFSGENGALIYTVVSPFAGYEGWFGCSVSGAGDLNDDERDDFIVGAYGESPGMSPERSGRVYVFSGDDGTLLYSLISPTQQTEGWFGCSVSGSDDVDGDGIDDLIVGSLEGSGTSPSNAGRAHVFSGATGALLYALSSPDEEASGFFGWSVSGGGDVNGDGWSDFVIGAWLESPGASPMCSGRSYVFNGSDGSLLYTLASPNETEHGYFGFSVSGVDDVNDDGHPDIIIGAKGESPSSAPDIGRAYVFDGLTGTMLDVIDSPNGEARGYFGFSVSGLEDKNGNSGMIIIGAYEESPGATPDRGGVVYVFSPTSDEFILSGALANGELVLEWTTCPNTDAYWVYGSDDVHFQPGSEPDYEHRQAELSSGITQWSSPQGIEDEMSNWAYLILAVDSSGQPILRSNRLGEHDYSCDIP